MGLDITAYSKLELLAQEATDEHRDMDDVLVVYQIEDFAGRERPLIIGAAYRTSGEEFAFRAGSYSGYNRWRNQLCEMANGIPAHTLWNWSRTRQDFAFFELIHFADNEGVIGPEVSAKLAREFESRAQAASALNDPYFFELYQVWNKAFRMAAGRGCVLFH